jgi:glycosyltransferase involved in cell wall biosynthesis
MPKVSIVTPTYDREPTVTALMRWIRNQTHTDWEWWLLHDGPSPYSRGFQDAAAADPRIHYLYERERRSIGAKTNEMLERATGEIIMHFDDDDYYAPTYVETMVAELENFDFVKLSGWFLYKIEDDFLAYWHQSFIAPYHYKVAPNERVTVVSTRSFDDHVLEENRWGYGFSYAYRSRVRDFARLSETFCHNAGKRTDARRSRQRPVSREAHRGQGRHHPPRHSQRQRVAVLSAAAASGRAPASHLRRGHRRSPRCGAEDHVALSQARQAQRQRDDQVNCQIAQGESDPGVRPS